MKKLWISPVISNLDLAETATNKNNKNNNWNNWYNWNWNWNWCAPQKKPPHKCDNPGS